MTHSRCKLRKILGSLAHIWAGVLRRREMAKQCPPMLTRSRPSSVFKMSCLVLADTISIFSCCPNPALPSRWYSRYFASLDRSMPDINLNISTCYSAIDLSTVCRFGASALFPGAVGPFLYSIRCTIVLVTMCNTTISRSKILVLFAVARLVQFSWLLIQQPTIQMCRSAILKSSITILGRDMFFKC